MYKLLYKLSNIGKLGTTGYMPIPYWLKTILTRYPMQQRILAYSRIMKGQRAFSGVPQEVGCANAVTGILEMIDRSFFGGEYTVDRIDSTIKFTQLMVQSDRFIELNRPIDGCIVMCTTGTGNGILSNGHTGIYDRGRIFNNSSYTGKWTDSYTLMAWKERYEGLGGMRTRYFFPLSDK